MMSYKPHQYQLVFSGNIHLGESPGGPVTSTVHPRYLGGLVVCPEVTAAESTVDGMTSGNKNHLGWCKNLVNHGR